MPWVQRLVSPAIWKVTRCSCAVGTWNSKDYCCQQNSQGKHIYDWRASKCLPHRSETLISNPIAVKWQLPCSQDLHVQPPPRPLCPEGHTQHTPNSTRLLSLPAKPPHTSTMLFCCLLQPNEQISARSQVPHAHLPKADLGILSEFFFPTPHSYHYFLLIFPH